eukprot:9492749-Pyramimonas_sp.AAC.1
MFESEELDTGRETGIGLWGVVCILAVTEVDQEVGMSKPPAGLAEDAMHPSVRAGFELATLSLLAAARG